MYAQSAFLQMPLPALNGATLAPAFTAALSSPNLTPSASAVFGEYEAALHVLHELDERVSTLYGGLTDAALQSELYAFLRVKDDFVTRIKRRAQRKHHQSHITAPTSKPPVPSFTPARQAETEDGGLEGGQVESAMTVEELQALLIERAKAEGKEVRVTVTNASRKSGRQSQWKSTTSPSASTKTASLASPPALQSPKAKLSAVLKDMAGEQPQASEDNAQPHISSANGAGVDSVAPSPLSPVTLPKVRPTVGAGRGRGGRSTGEFTRVKPAAVKAAHPAPRPVTLSAVSAAAVVRDGGVGETARLKEETEDLGLRLQQLAQQHQQLQDKQRAWEAKKTTQQDTAAPSRPSTTTPQGDAPSQQAEAPSFTVQEEKVEVEAVAAEQLKVDRIPPDDHPESTQPPPPSSPRQTLAPLLTSPRLPTAAAAGRCVSPLSSPRLCGNPLLPSLPPLPLAMVPALTPHVITADPSPRDLIRQPIADMNGEAQGGMVCAGLMLIPATARRAEPVDAEPEPQPEMAAEAEAVEDNAPSVEAASEGPVVQVAKVVVEDEEADEAAQAQPIAVDEVPCQLATPQLLLRPSTSELQKRKTAADAPSLPLLPLPSADPTPFHEDSPSVESSHTLAPVPQLSPRLTLRPSSAEMEVHSSAPPSLSIPSSPRTPGGQRRLTQPPSPASRTLPPTTHLTPSSRSRTASNPTPSNPDVLRTFAEDVYPSMQVCGVGVGGAGGGVGGGGVSRRPSMGAVREAEMEAAVEAAEERIKKERWAAVMAELAAKGGGRRWGGQGGEGEGEGGEGEEERRGRWRRMQDETAITANDLRRQMRLMGLTVDGAGEVEGVEFNAQLEQPSMSSVGMGSAEQAEVDPCCVPLPESARTEVGDGETLQDVESS